MSATFTTTIRVAEVVDVEIQVDNLGNQYYGCRGCRMKIYNLGNQYKGCLGCRCKNSS